MRKTAYLQEFEVKKEHNSCKKWRKLMAFELDLTCIKIKWYTKFQINMSKHVGEKCGKLWRTDGRTDGDPDGRTDGHHHTIIRPVWRRAYNNKQNQKVIKHKYIPHVTSICCTDVKLYGPTCDWDPRDNSPLVMDNYCGIYHPNVVTP